MHDLPEECPATVEHALIHLKSALDSMHHRDEGQTEHDFHLTKEILENILESSNAN